MILYSLGACNSRNSLNTGLLTSLCRSELLCICLLRLSTRSLDVGSSQDVNKMFLIIPYYYTIRMCYFITGVFQQRANAVDQTP